MDPCPSLVWPTVESRTAEEQNSTHVDEIVVVVAGVELSVKLDHQRTSRGHVDKVKDVVLLTVDRQFALVVSVSILRTQYKPAARCRLRPRHPLHDGLV